MAKNSKTKKVQYKVIASASLNGIRISPRKTRLVLNMIKHSQVEPALQMLKFEHQKRSNIVERLLRSALANAREKSANIDNLWVAGGWVDGGAQLKRFRPKAKGQAAPIRCRTSKITIQLGEIA